MQLCVQYMCVCACVRTCLRARACMGVCKKRCMVLLRACGRVRVCMCLSVCVCMRICMVPISGLAVCVHVQFLSSYCSK